MAKEDVADMLRGLVAKPFSTFRGDPWYNAAGDCLVWYFANRESYAARIDDKLTVYRSFGDDDLVGCQVKGISALFRKFGDFGVRFDDGGISLELIFYVSHFDADRAGRDLCHSPHEYLVIRIEPIE